MDPLGALATTHAPPPQQQQQQQQQQQAAPPQFAPPPGPPPTGVGPPPPSGQAVGPPPPTSLPPPEPVDPVREFLGGQYFDKPKLATLHPDLGGLRALAQAGQFEQLVALSEVVMQGLARLPPHERLAVRHARLVAFLRLRKHDFANAELEEVGELDRPQYCYETYATAYPDGRKGSFVPFSLRVLKAEMPGRLSSERTAVDDTVDALLALRGWCRSQSGSDDTEPWRSRDDFITERLVAHATAAQEVEKALSLMKEQAERRPVEQQSSWLTKLGRVYLQYGQLAAAEDAFSRAEAYSSGGDDEDIVHELNAALVLVAKGNYADALLRFDDVLELDPSNLLAANNKAICMLYTCNLAGAIAFLESVLRADIQRNMHNGLVFNLAMMYDLAAHNAKEKKRTLQVLAQRYGSDDFDTAVLKLG